MYRLMIGLILFCLGLTACQQIQQRFTPLVQVNKNPQIQQALHDIAAGLSVQIEVLKNPQALTAEEKSQCDAEGADWSSCFFLRLSIQNLGEDIQASSPQFALYMHSTRRLLKLQNQVPFALHHINGDLHQFKPTEGAFQWESGKTFTFDILGEYWLLQNSDIFPRLFIADEKGHAANIPMTDTENTSQYAMPIDRHHSNNWKRTTNDGHSPFTPEARYKLYQSRMADTSTSWQSGIIPKPLNQTVHDQSISVQHGFSIIKSSLPFQQIAAIQARFTQLGLSFSRQTKKGMVPIRAEVIGQHMKHFHPELAIEGGYTLQVSEHHVLIQGYDDAGVFYGFQSLLGLIDVKKQTLPLTTVYDAPRFAYRGLFIDIARNFFGLETLKKIIDQMAAYKLNRLQLHLSDDEGWRIEIPSIPELTEVAGQRCFDPYEQTCLLPQLGSGATKNNSGSGFLTAEEYKALLRYADDRMIQVIPEIDMPAHARAAIVAMEHRYQKYQKTDPVQANQYRLREPKDTSRYLSIQYYKDSYVDPCLDSTYQFIDRVMGDIQQMHNDTAHPLTTWHFGGDEAVNSMLGHGFESKNGTDPTKGNIALANWDAPWSRSPACAVLKAKQLNPTFTPANYFAKRVSQLVKARGIQTLGAWSDGVTDLHDQSELETRQNLAYVWKPRPDGATKTAAELAQKGFGLIQASSDALYFDMPYSASPNERGTYWASRDTDSYKAFSYAPLNLSLHAKNNKDRDGHIWQVPESEVDYTTAVKGIQGQIWTETIRTPQLLEAMLFPRLLSLAERAWHRASWEDHQQSEWIDQIQLNQDWSRFAAIVGHKELFKLEKSGVHFHLPAVGAQLVEGHLKLQSAFPGINLQYLAPNGEWKAYHPEQPPEHALAIRSTSVNGDRSNTPQPLSISLENLAEK